MYGVYSKFTSTPNCNEDIFNRAIAHEPSAEFDEHSFVPERFLAPNVSAPDPGKWAFGFGRRSGDSLEMYLFLLTMHRICPGKALAENSLFVIIAGILSVFDISTPVEGDLKVAFSPNLVRSVA